MLIACLCSSFAAVSAPAQAHVASTFSIAECACLSSLCLSPCAVYFEMMLKQSQSSLWLRNIQLGVWATSIALISVAVTKDPLAPTHGYLHGFGPITWAVVASNAFGGLLVAVTIKYADNILRGFAQAVALIVGAIGSNLLFEFHFRAFLPASRW